jgi:hypothetical protein
VPGQRRLAADARPLPASRKTQGALGQFGMSIAETYLRSYVTAHIPILRRISARSRRIDSALQPVWGSGIRVTFELQGMISRMRQQELRATGVDAPERKPQIWILSAKIIFGSACDRARRLWLRSTIFRLPLKIYVSRPGRQRLRAGLDARNMFIFPLQEQAAKLVDPMWRSTPRHKCSAKMSQM